MSQEAVMTLPEKVLDHIGYADAALTKAAAAMDRVGQVKKACADLIPKAVDALVENERITPQQREKAAQVLADPVQCLELLIKVAGHRNAAELGQLGTPVGQTKTAGANGNGSYDPSASLNSPHVGARTTMVKQSDVNLFSRLGLQPPSGD